MIPFESTIDWFLRISCIVILARWVERMAVSPTQRFTIWKLTLVIVTFVPLLSNLFSFALGPVQWIPLIRDIAPASEGMGNSPLSVVSVDGTIESSSWNVVWLIGGILACARMTVNGAALMRWLREGKPADPEWDRLASELGNAFGYSRRVSILFHPQVTMPGTWQWGRPVIFFPMEAEYWSRTKKTLTLRHEMIHLRNYDPYVQLFSLFLRSIWWWHPMVYWMHSRLMVTCEMSCDAAVTSAHVERTTYAQWLLEAGRKTVRSMSVMMLMARRSSLGERVSVLLNDATVRPVFLLRSRFVFSFVLLLFLGVASVSLSFRSTVTVIDRSSVGAFAFQSLEETIRAAYSENPHQRSLAAWSLSQFDEMEACDALEQLSRDPDAIVRENALYSMGENGNPHSVPYVRTSLHDPIPAVRIAALGAAASFPEIVSDVEPLLDDETREVRLIALCVWVGLKGEDSAPVLLGAAVNRDEAFRMKAAELLGPFAQPMFVRALIQLLNDPSESVRNQAALAVGQHRRSEAQSALVPLLRDPSQIVRSTAAWALKQL